MIKKTYSIQTIKIHQRLLLSYILLIVYSLLHQNYIRVRASINASCAANIHVRHLETVLNESDTCWLLQVKILFDSADF